MVDYMKESLRLLNENIDLNADLVRCRLKLKQAEAEVTDWQDVAEQRLESHLVVTQKVCRLEAELAKLKTAIEIAAGIITDEGVLPCSADDLWVMAEQHLAELDKEGER
jgi:hypothetical protein